MAAAVLQRRRLPVGTTEEEHDILAEQPERLGAVGQIVERHHRVPEAAQHFLYGGQHRAPRRDGVACNSALAGTAPISREAGEHRCNALRVLHPTILSMFKPPAPPRYRASRPAPAWTGRP